MDSYSCQSFSPSWVRISDNSDGARGALHVCLICHSGPGVNKQLLDRKWRRRNSTPMEPKTRTMSSDDDSIDGGFSNGAKVVIHNEIPDVLPMEKMADVTNILSDEESI